MRPMLLSVLLVSCLSSLPALAVQPFSSLEERMSAADFQRAGLHKLSAEELAALNVWLQRDAQRRGQPVAELLPAPDDRRGLPLLETDPDTITSTVVGEFRGWTGMGDLITLANGQVWRVTDSDTRLRVRLNDPVITIQRGGLGGWMLAVEGYNTRARVVRVR